LNLRESLGLKKKSIPEKNQGCRVEGYCGGCGKRNALANGRVRVSGGKGALGESGGRRSEIRGCLKTRGR